MQCTLVLRTVHEGFLGLVESQQRAVNDIETGLLDIFVMYNKCFFLRYKIGKR